MSKINKNNIPVRLGGLFDDETKHQAGSVWDKNAICPTIDTMMGGYREPIIVECEDNKMNDDNLGKPHKIDEIGQVSNDGSQAGKVYSPEGVSPTICACTHGYAIGNILDKIKIRIRKLTPRECFKLMGLTFDDCDKAANMGVSNSQLYKQAGNGIITNCCELLAEHLYKAQYDDTYICTDENMINFIKPQVE